MINHLATGPNGSQTPIDLDQCRNVCSDFLQAETSVKKLCAFLEIPHPPQLIKAPGGAGFIGWEAVDKGQKVFSRACASGHSDGDR